VQGSGTLATETRSVTGFTEIVLAGFGEVEVVVGQSAGLVIEAEDNLLPYLTARVSGERLVLGTQPNVSLTPTRSVVYTVTLPDLERVELSGSGTVTVLEVAADELRVQLPGSGTIKVSGTVEEFEAALPGSGTVEAGDLRAKDVRVELPGSGDLIVWATDSLRVTLNGSGTISYYGQPANLEQSINGSGDITALGEK
jgi:hypothetical protein